MSDWWARKLAQAASGQPTHTQPPPASVSRPSPPVRPVTLPPKEDLCPGCYGTNYVAPPNSERKRCFDCGWPIVQSGSGVGSTKADAPAKAATQVATDGYRPTQIVGRVE